MKPRIRKLTSLLLSLSLISARTLPAAASNALGEDLSAKDTLLHQETQLSTNVFWSTTYSDLRTENLITYTPNKAVNPIVTYGDLIEGFPYDDGVFMFKVTGQQLRQMLHYMLREEAYTGHTEFYQLPSTLRLRYDRAKGDFDYFTYCGKEVGKEIGDDALFTVGLQNYHFKNIESFFNISYETICKLQKPRSVATSCQDILMEYIRQDEMVDASVDGRMTILPSTAQTG